jgi:hypothetical protein
MRVAAMLFAACIVFGVLDAEACLCIPRGNDRAAAKQVFDQSDAVFIGRVVRVERLEPVGGLPTGSTESGARVTFLISKALKGPTGSTVEVATVGSSDSCGATFEPDTDYVVFAGWSSMREDFTVPLAVNKCNGTNDLQFMERGQKEWLAFLRELPDLRKETEPDELRHGGCASCSSGGSGLSLLPLLVLARLARRRSRRATTVDAATAANEPRT